MRTESQRYEATLVSVAMTTYNGSRFLRRQLDSLIDQIYRPLEIVVSDDCSVDGTLDILEEYQRRFPDILRFSQNIENLGFTKNFEKAISMCRGYYIALCDQDDVWAPEKIQLLVEGIRDRDMIHSDARLIDDEDRIIAESLTSFAGKDAFADFPRLLMRNSVTGCTALLKKPLADRAIPFPRLTPHDYWLALLAADGNGIGYLPNSLVDYRQHGTNAIGAHSADKTGISEMIDKTAASWKATQRSMNSARIRALRELLGLVRGRMSIAGQRQVEALLDYYESYFTRHIRLRAFIYYINHFHAMCGGKSLPRAISRLFLSLYGEGIDGKA